MTTSEKSAHHVPRWIIGVITATLTSIIGGLVGHAIGYEKAIQRVDTISADISMVRGDVIDLRARQSSMGISADRDRTEATRRLEKIEDRLESIYQELRRIR
jgi:tetrahydromethanopterin S-methyltransferase subunit G